MTSDKKWKRANEIREFWIRNGPFDVFTVSRTPLRSYPLCIDYHVIETKALYEANARIKELEEKGEKLAEGLQGMIDVMVLLSDGPLDKAEEPYVIDKLETAKSTLDKYRGESKGAE